MSNAPRFAVATLALLLSACASFSSLHSETSIDAGQSFLLGGEQTGSFRATVKNTGAVPVTVLVEARGVRRPVIELAPDSSIEAEFQSKETAIFTNASARRAVVTVDIRGGDSHNLGMRYRRGDDGR